MSDTKHKSNLQEEEELVFPSKFIGVEEQFLPSENSTYVENHEIRAALPGRLFIDKYKYRAKVFPFKKGTAVPSRYDIVIGQVIRVSRSSVRLNIGYLNNRPISPTQSAIMHISDASRDYVKNLDDYFAAGDIIRAKINDAKTYPLQLMCNSRDLGVIFTTCKFCGGSVTKVKKNTLKCEECGEEQSRGTTIDYGNVDIMPKY